MFVVYLVEIYVTITFLKLFCTMMKKASETATDCMEAFRPLKECMDENGIVMGGQDYDDIDDRSNDEN